MATKTDSYLIASILFILLAGLGQQDTTLCRDRVEVCLPSASPFRCSCGNSFNTQCFWISFADHDKRLSDMTSEPILMWNMSTGYGQYMCIRADNLTTERTILILPEAQRTCDGCIRTRVCRATTGKYLLQFTKLFDQSLLAGGDCELHFTNLDYNGTLTEEECRQLLPNFNYFILCTICYPDTQDIHYVIPIFNIENCSDSDFCSSRSPTTTATSTMTTNASTATTTTYITMTATSTTFPVTTTVNMSDVSSGHGDDENNVGIIIGVVGGGIVAIIIVSIIFIVLFCRHKKSDSNGSSTKEITSQLLALGGQQLMDVIRENHPIISGKIKFDTLIKYLNKYRIFTPGEMYIFNNQLISPNEKVNHLITFLEKKEEDGVLNFVRALNDAHEHSGHVAILEQLHKCVTTV